MVTQRNAVVAILLTLVTCGIYGIYWFITLTNDVSKLSGDSSFTGGKHFLLSIITCGIWSYIWSYQVGKQLVEIQRKNNQTVTDNSTLYLILMVVGAGIVNYILVQNEVNKYAQQTA